MLGCVIVWRICSAGVAVSGIVPGLSYHAHARARAAGSRRPCDNVYIIARHSPAPGVLFKSFRAFRSPRCPHQLPPPSLSIKKLLLPHFLHLHSLKHITMPLSLKISPSIEFLSFRQSNCSQPQINALRDFKGIIRNQQGTAQNTICRISNENMLNTTPICGMM